MNIGLKSLASASFCLVLLVLLLNTDFSILANFSRYEDLTLYAIGVFIVICFFTITKFYGGRHSSMSLLIRPGPPKQGEVVLIAKKKRVVLRENTRRTAFDFPMTIHYLIILFGVCLLSSILINDRTILLVKNISDKFKPSSAEYCIESEEEEEEEEKPGCALVKRAYEMGYADSLGDCGSKKGKKKEKSGQDGEEEEEIDIEEEICRLRQLDEPYLHYTWRQIKKIYDQLIVMEPSLWLETEKKIMEEKEKKFSEISKSQLQTLTSSPRSSHHIFTNLPPPDGWFIRVGKQIFQPNYCVEKYANLETTLDVDLSSDGLSERIEFVYAHLLFNAKHGSPVGYCREYQIHWDAPNACSNLASNPEKYLSYIGIKDDVDEMFNRIQTNKVVKDLNNNIANFTDSYNEVIEKNKLELKDKLTHQELITEKEKLTDKKDFEKKPPAGPEQSTLNKSKIVQDKGEQTKDSKTNDKKTKNFNELIAEQGKEKVDDIYKLMSFNCFMVGEENTDVKVYKVPLYGKNFEAGSITVSRHDFIPKARVPINWLKKFAKLLVRDFNYSGFLSKQQIRNAAQGDLSKKLLNPNEFMLSKSDLLSGVDLMIGNEWLHNTPEIMEVYPWYLHLSHFIRVFRKKYTPLRGRM